MELCNKVSSVAVILLITTFFNVPGPLRFPSRMKKRGLNARHGNVTDRHLIHNTSIDDFKS